MEKVSYKVFLADMARGQRRLELMSWLIWFEVVLVVVSNAAWLIYEILRRFG